MRILDKFNLQYLKDFISNVYFWVREKKDIIFKSFDFLLLIPIIIAPCIGLNAFLIIFLFTLTAVITMKQNNYAINMNNPDEIKIIKSTKEKIRNESWSYCYNFLKRKTNNTENENKEISTCRKIVNSYEEEMKIENKQDDNNPTMGLGNYKNLLKAYVESIFISILNFRNMIRISIMSGSIWYEFVYLKTYG